MAVTPRHSLRPEWISSCLGLRAAPCSLACRSMKDRGEFLWGLAGTLAVASLTACLYLSGVAYQAGYVRELRLPAGLIPSSYQAALEAGGYAWMHLGASTLPFLFIVPFGGMASVLLYALIRRRAPSFRTQPSATASSLRPNKSHGGDQTAASRSATDVGVEPATQFAFDVIHRLATLFLLLMFGLISLLVLLELSAKAGAEFARGQTNCPEVASDSVPPGCARAELDLTDNAQKLVGHLIQCTEHHCVLQVQGGLLVLRVDDIKRIAVPADGRRVP
jgi:hypothetical protein